MGPARETERRWREHYNRTARSYDRKEWLWGVLLGYSDRGERRKLMDRLDIKPEQRLLEVSVGTGGNLAAAAAGPLSRARLTGADISVGMLRTCRENLKACNLSADLIEGDAAHLPLRSDVFDALLHFGAISQFGDKKAAISEMVRVVKPGARVVIGDVGVQPDKRRSLRARLVLRANPRYAASPPIDLLPRNISDVQVEWIRNNTCYIMQFVKV